MILQSLYKLAAEEELIDDPDFEFKPISWVVRLGEDGLLVNIEDWRSNANAADPNKKLKFIGKPILIPKQPGRTSGDRAFFLVDKMDYALGADPKRPKRPILFHELIQRCAEATGDKHIKAVLDFLKGVINKGAPRTLPMEASPNDLFAFKVGHGEFVHLRPEVKKYWKSLRSLPAEKSGSASARCLITGQHVENPGLFPLIKRVPGGTTSGVAIVSFNDRAFESYGLDGNANAPVSRDAAEAAAKSLNRLLDPNPLNGKGEKLPRRHIRLSADTVVVYWSPERSQSSFLDAVIGLQYADSVEAVADAYRSIWDGRFREMENPAAFYAMTITGTQGRAVVRDWLETTVGDVMRNLAAHFSDLKIVRNCRPAKGKNLPPACPLRHLLESLSPQGKSDQIPAALAVDFFHAALRGTPYPFAILQKALLRERAEIRGNEWIDISRRDARAALIKAVLNRRRRFHSDAASQYSEVNIDMNPITTSQGYNLGSLLAVIERLQTEALGDVNASVIDRYFASASATPQITFDRLLKNARHHARKASDKNRGQVILLERLLDELASRFNPNAGGFPSHLNQEQQGLFVLGYHQMRKFLWMNAEERVAWEASYPEAAKAFVRSKKSEIVDVAN